MRNPDISVLLPIYQGKETLKASIESVASQVGDFNLEIVAIDDGSTDGSLEVLKGHVDKRYIVISQNNQGLAMALNNGLEKASGRYIARQDQDDLYVAGRLSAQYEFLERNPDIAMVGTWAHIYRMNEPTSRFHKHPLEPKTIQLELLFNNPIVHSSVMIRADVLREVGGYSTDRNRQPPEDYELWSRISKKYSIANLPNVLTIYKEMPGSMSRVAAEDFRNNIIKISSENLSHYLSPKFTYMDCMQLSTLMHASENTQAKLKRKKAIEMLDIASFKIGGTKADWSREYYLSYSSIKMRIEYSLGAKGYLRRALGNKLNLLKKYLNKS